MSNGQNFSLDPPPTGPIEVEIRYREGDGCSYMHCGGCGFSFDPQMAVHIGGGRYQCPNPECNRIVSDIED
ncbi:hypothetical protein KJ903_00050 [Patescibacteria group bacterium]|nr:hypothetical protein [Patescibacteria group bacterium]